MTGSRRRFGLVRAPAVAGLVVALCAFGGVLATPADASPTTWATVSSPNRGSADNMLNGVSCADATHCVAVGSDYNGTADRTLVEQLVNGTWKLMTSPNRGAGSNDLNSVSCADATHCVAVGEYFSGTQNKTLVESLSAGKWSVVSSPNGAGGAGLLSGVSCPSATSCYAVGEGGGPFIETLAAGKWSKMAVASGGETDSLDGVSCATTSRCVAVGSTNDAHPTSAELRSGVWTRRVAVMKGTMAAGLHSVSCPTATRCYASGFYYVDAATFHTLTERFAAPTWVVQSSRNQGTGRNMLFGAGCGSTTSCTAVGYSNNGPSLSDSNKSLVLDGNGTKWSLVASPDRGADSNVLQAVDCPTASRCVAVGEYNAGTELMQRQHTLIVEGS